MSRVMAGSVVGPMAVALAIGLTSAAQAQTQINGTPIKFVKPFHVAGAAPNVMIAAAEAPAVADPRGALRYIPGA